MSFDILEKEVLLPIVAVVIEQLMTEYMFEISFASQFVLICK